MKKSSGLTAMTQFRKAVRIHPPRFIACFFFQAEDGIRDLTVTGVQTCALPISRVKRWVLTPRTLSVAHAYLSGYALLEQATTHLIDLNQESGESVSLSEPDDTDMVFIARFPSHKRFFIHMPIGRRLPMYCTASGRAYLSALPAAEVQRILRRSALRQFTPTTLTDAAKILERIAAAREAGYEWSDQECYRGDVTLAAPMLGEMALALPAVRSFTEFARAGLGPWAGFVAGWLYWYFWIIVVPVEAIAGANILHAWLPLPAWVLGLGLMAVMTGVNLMSARS